MAEPKNDSLAGNRMVVTGKPAAVREGRVLDVAIHEGSTHHDTTLFFCHGMGGNKNQWRNQWVAFAERGYRMVAWDSMGHGASRTPKRWRAYSGAAFIADHLAVVERYGSARNILIGHSYGTTTTLAVLSHLTAERRHSAIDRAILLGPPRPGPFPRLPVMHLPAFALEWVRPQIGQHFVDMAWGPNADRALLAYEAQATERNPMFMIKALTRQAPWINPVRLVGIDTPVLLLAGDHDRVTPADGVRQVAALLAHSRVEVLADCGHQIMLEQPQETNRLITAFIAAS